MEALQHLRERNKSGDKKAYYDAIEKELKVLEILKKYASWQGNLVMGEEPVFNLNIDYWHLNENDYNTLREWLNPELSNGITPKRYTE